MLEHIYEAHSLYYGSALLALQHKNRILPLLLLEILINHEENRPPSKMKHKAAAVSVSFYLFSPIGTQAPNYSFYS